MGAVSPTRFAPPNEEFTAEEIRDIRVKLRGMSENEAYKCARD